MKKTPVALTKEQELFVEAVLRAAKDINKRTGKHPGKARIALATWIGLGRPTLVSGIAIEPDNSMAIGDLAVDAF